MKKQKPSKAIIKALKEKSIKVAEYKFYQLADKMNDLFRGNAIRLFNELKFPIPSNKLNIYPNGCKLFMEGENELVFVIEQKPECRTLLTADGKNYHLPLPYVVFILTVQKQDDVYNFYNLTVRFRNEPLSSPNDMLYHSGLPNTESGYVCMGDWTHVDKDLNRLVDVVIGQFWQSMFGNYVTGFTYKDKLIDKFSKWQKIGGKKSRLKILESKFTPDQSLINLIKDRSSIVNKKDMKSLHATLSAWDYAVDDVTRPSDVTKFVSEIVSEAIDELAK